MRLPLRIQRRSSNLKTELTMTDKNNYSGLITFFILIIIVIALPNLMITNVDAGGLYIGTSSISPADMSGIVTIILIVGGLYILSKFVNTNTNQGSLGDIAISIFKEKRKVFVKRGEKTAQCPVCNSLLEVFNKSAGKCPDCKTYLEILYEG